MSRTPVRQALPVLAQEGLLSKHGTRGYVVKTISTADILDAIDLRGIMEGLAARRLAERGVSGPFAMRCIFAWRRRSDLQQRQQQESDEVLYADMNARFHDLIIREAHSPMIEQALERNARIPLSSSDTRFRQDASGWHVRTAAVRASPASLYR